MIKIFFCRAHISETLRNFVVQKGRHMKLVIKCGATSALDTP